MMTMNPIIRGYLLTHKIISHTATANDFTFNLFSYDPRDDGFSLENLYETLFHEASHQYMALAVGANEALLWLNEGMATYFEGVELGPDGTVEVGLPAMRRLQTLISMFEKRERPLEQMVTDERSMSTGTPRPGASFISSTTTRHPMGYVPTPALHSPRCGSRATAILRSASSTRRSSLPPTPFELAPDAHWHPMHIGTRCTLAPDAHWHPMHIGTRCTLAPDARRGLPAPTGRQVRIHHWKLTRTPFEKFEVVVPPTTSRCQAWKCQVCPGITAMSPPGVGVRVRSTTRRMRRAAPENPV